MKRSSKGVDILLFLFIIYSGLPILSAYLPSSANVLVVSVMYIYAAYKLNNSFLSIFILLIPLFAVEFLHCIGSAVWGGDNFFRDFYGILRKMLFPLFATSIIKEENKRLARNALLLTLIVYLITAITTINGNNLFPNASRTITDTFQEESTRYFLKSFNIGDFQYVYTVALSLPLIVYFGKYKHINLILAALFFALFLYMIYAAEFTIALMFSVFTIALFFVPKSYSVKRVLVLSGVFFIVLIFSRSFWVDMLQKVSEIIGSETMGQRFSDMSESLSGTTVNDESDYALRTEAWLRSWNSFIKNPLSGTFGKSGGHSLILDTIGGYGLIGIITLMVSYISMYKRYVRHYTNYDIYLYVSYIYLLNVAFSLFNTLIMYMVFTFIIPLTAFCYSKKNEYSK